MSSAETPVLIAADEAYARWAPSYDETPNPLTALEQRLLVPVLGDFAGRDIVDLGCGTGRWLKRLETLLPRSLAGVDSSGGMLAEAARKCLHSTSLIGADCRSTPLAAGSADLVLASFLLSYLDNIDRFAAEAARILRTGGTLIVSDVHPDTRSYGWRRTFKTSGGRFEIATLLYSLARLVDCMKDAGLNLEQMNEAAFGEQEAEIFRDHGMAEEYARVESLPVIYYARFSRRVKATR